MDSQKKDRSSGITSGLLSERGDGADFSSFGASQILGRSAVRVGSLSTWMQTEIGIGSRWNRGDGA